jgi:hypothetical protein
MAKELPYFKFEPAEYLTKDISFCTLGAQGLFINICAYYWQRNCKLTKDQLLKRLNHLTEFDELIDEGVIDLNENGQTIVIKFLDNQLVDVEKTSKQNSANGAKGGRPKKPSESENKPTALISLSETKGIREDKIKEDKIKEENNSIDSRKLKFAHTLKPFLDIYTKETIRDFYDYWTEPNKSNTKFKQEMQKTWSAERRLKTWNTNNFNKPNGKQINNSDEFKQIIETIKSDGVRR